MFFRRKKQVPTGTTCEAMGAKLFEHFIRANAALYKVEDQQFAEQFCPDFANFAAEAMILRLFAIDFLIYAAFGPGSQTDRLQASFRAAWTAAYEPQTVEFLDTHRFPRYAESVGNARSEQGISASVGKAFAEFCNAERDAAIIMFGANQFHIQQTRVQLLRDLPIV